VVGGGGCGGRSSSFCVLFCLNICFFSLCPPSKLGGVGGGGGGGNGGADTYFVGIMVMI